MCWMFLVAFVCLDYYSIEFWRLCVGFTVVGLVCLGFHCLW